MREKAREKAREKVREKAREKAREKERERERNLGPKHAKILLIPQIHQRSCSAAQCGAELIK